MTPTPMMNEMARHSSYSIPTSTLEGIQNHSYSDVLFRCAFDALACIGRALGSYVERCSDDFIQDCT